MVMCAGSEDQEALGWTEELRE